MNYQYDKQNVVGDGYEFVLADKHSCCKYHLHLGAGKIGLGVLITNISKDTPVVLLQRNSESWKILKREQVRVIVNGYEVLKIMCTERKEDVYADVNTGKSVLYLFDTDEEIYEIINQSNSISTALGKGLQPMLKYFTNGKNQNVYLFENDIDSVESAIEALNKHNFNGIKTVIDKICYDRKINERDIAVKTESDEYESIIVNDEDEYTQEIFDGIKPVRMVNDKEVFEYLRKKKIYLVNSLHVMFALKCYDLMLKDSIPMKIQKAQVTSILGKTPEIYKPVMLLGEALIVYLLTIVDVETVKKEHCREEMNDIYQELCKMNEITMLRIQKCPDSLSRIIDDDISVIRDRYDKRIRAIIEYYNNNENKIKRTMELLRIETSKIKNYKRGLDEILKSIARVILQ